MEPLLAKADLASREGAKRKVERPKGYVGRLEFEHVGWGLLAHWAMKYQERWGSNTLQH